MQGNKVTPGSQSTKFTVRKPHDIPDHTLQLGTVINIYLEMVGMEKCSLNAIVKCETHAYFVAI